MYGVYLAAVSLYLGTDIPVPQQTSIDHSDYDEIKVKGNTLRC